MSLADRLRARAPLRVHDFMEASLYDPEEGYYTKGPRIGGAGADFYTASNASLFPHALARFVQAAVERLGGARVVELGAGEGDLAKRLGVDVLVVEPSVGLARKQEARGLQVVRGLDELRPAPTVFIANEVLDALPVHRVVMTPDGLRECYLDAQLREVAGALSSGIDATSLDFLPDGAKAEIAGNATRSLLEAMARAGPKSLALFLDYGSDSPQRLYGEHAMDGTLRGFREHRVTSAFDSPGMQDITADVDFARAGALATSAGFDVAGLVPQGQFLADSTGIVDDMQGALSRGDMAAFLAAKNLLMPTGMGERFQAMLLARGAVTTPSLPGFRRDIYPGASRR